MLVGSLRFAPGASGYAQECCFAEEIHKEIVGSGEGYLHAHQQQEGAGLAAQKEPIAARHTPPARCKTFRNQSCPTIYHQNCHHIVHGVEWHRLDVTVISIIRICQISNYLR